MDDIEIDGRLWRPVALRPPKKRDWYTKDMKWVYRSGCASIQTALIVEPVEPESPLATTVGLGDTALARVDAYTGHLYVEDDSTEVELTPAEADRLCALWAEHKQAVGDGGGA